MKILICLGNVPDTTTKVRFVNDNTEFDKNGVQWVINPWDELALTRALELQEIPNSGIEKVTVITVGPVGNEPTIRKALAIGATDAIRVDAEAKDAYFVAKQIAESVKNENYDIIFTGIESSDYNGAGVGGMLAELLDLPSVSAVSKVELENGLIKLSRDIDGGKELIEIQTPLVITIQKGITKEPRIPSMRGIMQAKSKPMNVLPVFEAQSFTSFIKYELPPPKGKCRMVDQENVKELVDLLHNQAKVI